MKEKVRLAYEQASHRAGLRFDEEHALLYGLRDGYQILAYQAPGKNPYQLQVTVSAIPSQDPLTQGQKIEFIRDNPVFSLNQEGNDVVMTLNPTKQPDALANNLSRALSALLDFLRRGGWQPCCDVCGQVGGTQPHIVEDSYKQLCPTCANTMRQRFSDENRERRSRPESLPAGILGAFLGSLVGVLSILLFGRLGYISAWSGVLMGFCALKGYELLGGRLSRNGVIACAVIMILMTFVGDLLDWTIAVTQELETDFLTSLEIMPYLVFDGYITGDYLGNLALMYLFVGLGAVPTMRKAVGKHAAKGSFVRIGAFSSALEQ